MRRRLRHLFWPIAVETEVVEELQGHIALQSHRFMARGDAPAVAREKALARFGDGSRVAEECLDIRHNMEIDMHRSEFRDALRQDAIFALRGFRRTPMFTLVALFTIALGVGASTAIFSVVNTVLLRPLPYPNAERMMVLSNSYDQTGLEQAAVAGGELFDFRETFTSLDAIAGIRPAPATLTAEGSDPEAITAYAVTPNLFDVVGVRPQVGRAFLATDGTPGAPAVAILSSALWERRFGRDTAIIGKSVIINDVPRTIVGVMGDGMRFPDSPIGYAKERADLWIANTYETTRTPQQRGNQNLVVVGRMAPGATRRDIDRDLAATRTRFKREFPDRYASVASKHWHVVATTLRDEMVGTVRPALFLLTAAVGLVLLIACVNVANLLLARTALRQRELAVRLALGADRGRLMRQLLTESTLLALGGGALGIALAWAAVRGLRTFATVELPQLEGTRLDLTVLAFSFVLSAVAGLLIGFVPAFQQAGGSLLALLGESTRGASAGASRRRLRSVLVVAQVAMALVVLNTAGLLGRSFVALERIEPGFRPDGVMSAYVNLPPRQYDSAYKVNAFYLRLANDFTTLPGVTSVGGVYPLPDSNDGWSGSFNVEGLPKETQEGPHAEFAAAMPGYFRTMGIPLRGRDFTADDGLGRPPTVIVDDQLAKKYWPGQEAIGKRISQTDTSWMTIVGVASHVRRDGPAREGEPQIYLPYLQHPQGMLYEVVKTSAAPLAIAAPIRQVVKGIDRNLPVSKLQSVAALVHSALARQRFNLVMIGLFALTALALASVGLYGVMSYLVTQRTREIGIRVALGGQPNDVRGLIVKESMTIAVVGLAVGTVGSLAMSKGVASMLYGISATDPITYSGIAALLLSVSAIAAFGPARRAARVDPLTALRD